MINISKKQHFIPQFYLRGFLLDKTKKIWVYDKNKRKWWESRIQSIGYQKKIYNIEADGVEPDALEYAFAQLESEFAPVLNKIIGGKELPKENPDYSILINFIVLTILRNPKSIKKYKEFIDQTWKNILKSLSKEQISELSHKTN